MLLKVIAAIMFSLAGAAIGFQKQTGFVKSLKFAEKRQCSLKNRQY